MKKFIFSALIMVGCNNLDSKLYKQTDDYDIIVMDSCEYIKAHYYDDIVHSGNCRFCKERRQKELEELVEQLKKKYSYGSIH
jgi:hypothetical protein